MQESPQALPVVQILQQVGGCDREGTTGFEVGLTTGVGVLGGLTVGTGVAVEVGVGGVYSLLKMMTLASTHPLASCAVRTL